MKTKKPVKIQPSDIVSGSMYLKLLNDYKIYDSLQKEVITNLRKEVSYLRWQINDMRQYIVDEDAPSKKLFSKIDKLGKKIESLITENKRLTEVNKTLKKTRIFF